MVGSALCDSFDVTSYRGSYRVQVGCDAKTKLRDIRQSGDVLVCDRNVLMNHPFLAEMLSDRDEVLDVDETLKSYRGLEPLLGRIIDKGITKTSRIIAIGGGITQDCSAFMASILYRGLDWIFFPTNLLAQCDSCIGSKTSINFGAYKNLLGGFYPPREVFIDLNFLSTLSAAHLLSGLGEMLHYFMVTDWEGVGHYMAAFGDAASGDPAVLHGLIQKSLRIKKSMIERDEFDQGPRNVFNYGHTFGHALETATGYAVLHGVAVSYGMDLAALVSVDRDLLAMTERNRMRSACALVASRFALPTVDMDAYISALSKDKKNVGSGFSPILTRGVGRMFKQNLALDQPVIQRIKSFFADRQVLQDL